VSSLYQEVLNLFGRGELRPLPVEHFAIGDAIEAFHHMAQARHIGKVVLSLQDQPVAVEAAPKSLIQPDASYLITGGLGALGLEVASWLVGQGACQLALVGRSAPSATASAAIDALEAAGAKVLILQADVAQPSQLQAALEQVRT
jgi:phthiocerol/phenolphthiocerol synthesis type-I polyketide synthase C